MIVNNIEDNQINESIITEELSNSDSSELTTENTPLADTTIEEPKQDIMKHLKQINGDFSYFSAEEKKRSSKIREHIQKSLSWEKVEISVL